MPGIKTGGRKKCKGPCQKMKPVDAFSFKDKARTRRSGICKTCRATVALAPDKRARQAALAKIRRQKSRKELIAFLGGKCVDCGYDRDWRAMCIDHVYGDGCVERKQYAPNAIYPLVRKHQERYQLLCANCNQIKAYENSEWGPRDE